MGVTHQRASLRAGEVGAAASNEARQPLCKRVLLPLWTKAIHDTSNASEPSPSLLCKGTSRSVDLSTHGADRNSAAGRQLPVVAGLKS